MANRLQHESSPYLLQHANNPVDWYPWGDEAFLRAEEEEKPVFLSIGYSACHWCHVMEHESFEDERIARQLNDGFVSIKVDREERPDLDHIYMTAVQIMTGRGGWPMSVFLTPDRQAFFGGTYWPPTARMGMPGFDQVLAAISDAWQNRQAQAIEQAEQMTERIRSMSDFVADETPLDASLLDGAVAQLMRSFDGTYGGFGAAPKFPHAMDLQLLLRMSLRSGRNELVDAVRLTLDKMAAGGIYDHLGGGFARYSVDERWLVPHFEKMLYDNALLGAAYLDGCLATGQEAYARIVRETLDYVLRDLTANEGGFFSTEDADSEGEEGRFYVWTPQEIETIVGPDLAERFCEVYDVTSAGNFEGRNILNQPRRLEQVSKLRGWPLEELEQQMATARRLLFEARQQRVHPGKDDKVIVNWNGLMIDTLARAARALDESRYLQAATSAADFLQRNLWHDGRLLHTWREGRASLMAYLDDYAALANGLVSLYEASFEGRWLRWAFELMDGVLARFTDHDGGALFYTADDHPPLITRIKDLQDSSVPSGNAMAAYALLRLGHLGQRTDYRQAAYGIMHAAAPLMRQAPLAMGQMLLAVDLFLGPFYEVAVVANRDDPAGERAMRNLSGRYMPRIALALRDIDAQVASDDPLEPLFRDRPALDRHSTFYICQDNQCRQPITGEAALDIWPDLT